MNKSQFPKFKYHKDKPAVLVKSEADEKALGKTWADSPAEFGIITHPNPDEEFQKSLRLNEKKA